MVDNASSNITAVHYMKGILNNWGHSILDGKLLQMRCVAHILNLVVFYGLKDVNALVLRVRAAIRFVRQSPARMQKFKECVTIEKIESKNLLCLDVPTRWNSTYLMLEVARKFERAFNRFGLLDQNYKKDLDCVHGKDLDGIDVCGEPTRNDWEVCRRLVKILKNFYDLTLLVSGYNYVTSNTFFDGALAGVLKQMQESDDLDTSLMANRMWEKHRKYWRDNLENTNVDLIYVAAVLDPRMKFRYVSFAVEDTYGAELGSIMGKKVKDTTFATYGSYCKLFAPNVQHHLSVKHRLEKEQNKL